MSVITHQPNVLGRFVSTLDPIVRRHSNGTVDGLAIVGEVRPHFQRLLADTSWLEARYREPRNPEDATTYLLAKAPDGCWTMVSVVFPPGFSTPVHDHLIWGLIGVHQGLEQESRYKRLDGGDIPGYAKLRFAGTFQNEPVSISHLVPPAEDIHRIYNPLSTASCSIHIYGGHLDQVLRHKYDPDKDVVQDYRSKYVISC